MHDWTIVKESGCTPERLRQIFTAQPPPEKKTKESKDEKEKREDARKLYALRKKFERRVQARAEEGLYNSVASSRIYQAVDIAMDVPPISKETIPLLLWAQGKISNEHSLLKRIEETAGADIAKRFVRKSGKGVTFSWPKISNVTVNLVRSSVRRRHAEQTSLFSNLWPFFRYEPRGTDTVTQCKADVLSSRVDTICDQYNLRHLFAQTPREMLMYGNSTVFPRSAWDRKTGIRRSKANMGAGVQSDKKESYIVREGLDFVNPHPSRIFCDASSPRANINSDTGPSFIGYWDIIRYGDFCDDDSYFNRDKVFVSSTIAEFVSQNREYFAYYFSPAVLKFPSVFGADPTISNDRRVQVGTYSSAKRDQGIFFGQYFERINPFREGIAEYNTDIWIRLTYAGDGTIIGGEFMPSIPAVYGAIDQIDNRSISSSLAMELLTYQDQMTNIISQMIFQLRTSFIQLWLLDKDSLDPGIVASIQENATDTNWWMEPKMLLYSSRTLREMGIADPRQAFAIIQGNVTGIIENALKSMAQVLNLADRMMSMSPNELGQPNPREVSAKEVTEISNTTVAMHTFVADGIDEQRAGAKKLIYESLVTMGASNFTVPAMRRYTYATVKAAGFDVPTNAEEAWKEGDTITLKAPIIGTDNYSLIYEYIFDSRDGAERPLKSQGAQVLVSMAQLMMKVPPIAQKLAADGSLYDLFNLIIRMSGAPWDLNLSAGEGDKPAPDQTEMLQQLGAKMQQLEQVITQVILPKLGPPQGQPGQPPPQGLPGQAMQPQPANAVSVPAAQPSPARPMLPQNAPPFRPQR